MRQGYDNIFLANQIFDVDVSAVRGDFSTTSVTELFTNQLHLFTDNFHQTIGAAQNVQQFSDLFQQLFVFVEQFFVLKAGQFLQTQIQNSLGLLFSQIVLTVTHAKFRLQPFRTRGVITGTFQHGGNVAQFPRTRNQRSFRFSRGRRAADQFDDRIDVRQRNRQRFKDVRTVAGFTQFKDSTTSYDFTAVTYERGNNIFQVHDLRLAMVQCNHVDTEGNLQLGLGIEVVQNHFPDRIAFHFNHDAHTVFVRLVTQRADAFNAFVFYQLGDFLNQARFVYLIRNFVNDDGFTTRFGIRFDFRACANVHFATTGTVGFFDTTTTVDDRGSREVRTRNMFHQPFNADVFIVNICQTAVDHFSQVVRRNVGRHTYRDTGRTVHQQVRNFGRHDVRNLFGAVVVIDEINRFFFQVSHQLMGDFRHTDFRITHRRCGVAIDRTKVTLTIYQHVAQGEWLRHTNNGVVNGGITMRVVFTDYVTNDTGRFFIGFIPVVAQYVHGVKYATVNRLQAISDVRQRTANNDRHRIIQIGALQLFLNVDRCNFSRKVAHLTAIPLLYPGFKGRKL